jgi:hypothetical protein
MDEKHLDAAFTKDKVVKNNLHAQQALETIIISPNVHYMESKSS